jgi:uncharacterized protein YfaS (alpha-2-macroglobulin family)
MPWLRPLARFWTALLGCAALALAFAATTRLLAPLAPWAAAPALESAEPPDGAADVLPRTPITLRFNAPMNRASAAAALRLDPPTAGSLSWSDDASTLTFRPADALAPGVTYTVRLDAGALGRWWRPIEQPATVRFGTAQQPGVVAALPNAAGAPVDTSLAVIFSRPMVAPEAVGRDTALTAVQLAPPAGLAARWADERTLVLRPTAPLAPATRYTATIDPALADLRGVELGAPFSWSFTTAWPALLEHAPADGARWVSPRAPVSLRLDAPLDPALVERSLRITPPVTGTIAAAALGATQVITFTPGAGWAYDTAYTVELVEPPGSGLGRPPQARWSFEVEPRPRLLAFFPGQGQLLAPGQPIRLVFTTPMDEAALGANLSLEPAVEPVPISVSETEVRLTPELQPSTVYTVTVPAATTDRSGEPLGADVQVRVRTAPARPALAAPGAFDGIVTLPVGRAAAIDLAATNITALDLSLYRLDQPTLLLALDLGPEERRQFSPERYGQALARGWRVTRSDPPDRPTALTLPVGVNDGEALDPGAYFLRAVSPEGPRADLLLLVSGGRLTLRQAPDTALVWATDAATAAPLAGLPVTLYRDGAPLTGGVTGPDGALALPVAREAGGVLIALADSGGPAVVRGDWAARPTAQPSYSLRFFPDRDSYAPGGSMRLRGLARRTTPEGGLVAPAADVLCRLQLREAAGASVTPTVACAVDPATGVVSGEISLPARLAPGAYSLVMLLGDTSAAVPVRVDAPREASRALDLGVRPAPDRLDVAVSADGLPLAGTVVSWSLRLEPLAGPLAPQGFSLGPPPALEPRTLSGRATTDNAGAFAIAPLGEQEPPAGRRYLLRVESLDDSLGVAESRGIVPSAQTAVAVRLDSRIVPSDQRTAVELVALDAAGQPTAGVPINLQVFRVGAGNGGPLLARLASSGGDGRAAVQLVQLSPGEYEVVAAAAGGPPTRERLWVHGGRFAGWPAPDGQVELVADRDRYSPGDVATLLVAAPAPEANVLLTVERGAILSSEVRSLRAGQVITLPITPDMAPAVAVGAVVAAGDTLRAGTTTFAVDDGAAPAGVTLAADSAAYLPGATATLTITGAPLPAELLVTIAPDLGEADAATQASLLRPIRPAPSTVAALPPLQPAPAAPPAPAPFEPEATFLPLDGAAEAPGAVAARAPLPASPGRWRITAYAANDPGRIGAGSTVVTTTRPLDYALVTPPALRPGDSAGLALSLRNTSATTREVRVALAATGLALSPPSPGEQTVALPPGASGALAWEATPPAGAERATVRVTVASEELREALRRELPIVAHAPSTPRGTTFVARGPLAANLDLAATTGDVRIAVAPGLRAALADQAAALANLASPGATDRAALALIGAGLARGASAAAAPRWEAVTRGAVEALAATQNPDGGWGWWPGGPSEPVVTAFVVEAGLSARAALGDTSPPNLRAVDYLGDTGPSADPDARAYIAYVLSRSGADPADIPAALSPTALLDAPLSADGLAFLALALPAAQAAPPLDRLAALAERVQAAPPVLRWSVDAPGALPRSPAAVTAAAAQALAVRRPGAPELPGAERALLAAWGVDGWSTSYEAARIAAALLARAPQPTGPRQVLLDGAPILGSGAPITTTLRASVPRAGLGASPALSAQADAGSSYLVASSVGAAPPAVSGRLAVGQELVDPATGTALDPNALRLGQLVALRVTAVVPEPLLRADLEVALPGGLEPATTTPRAPFIYAAGPDDRHRLRFGAANLAPGVYTQTILARAVAGGTYAAPPARLAATFDPELVAIAPAAMRITIAE